MQQTATVSRKSFAPLCRLRGRGLLHASVGIFMAATAAAVPINASWNLESAAGHPVVSDPSGGVSFDGVGNAGRAYLRTHKADFHKSSFVAEITVTVNGGGGPGSAFIGMGKGLPDPGFFLEPAAEPCLYLRLAPTDFGGGVILRENDEVITADGTPGDGTHRIRLTWDADAMRLQAEIDHHHAGRAFVRDGGIMRFGDLTGFTADSAHLFIGGASGVSFGPLHVRPATPRDLARFDVSADRWLSVLPGSTRLSQLSIPGTHNAAARFETFGGTAKCQDLTIAEQLEAGIRYLDIRCRHISDIFAIHHGVVFQNLYFGEVLAQIDQFLDANPGECVMMVVKEEHTSSGNSRTFAETFQSYVNADPSRWWLGTSVPTLEEARGKIVLIRRFGGYPGGINATNWPDNTSFLVNNLAVEDQYVVPDNDVKWNRILTAFDGALAQADADILHLTHTSGYRSGLFGIPSIPTVSNHINPRLESHFTGRPAGNHGCVIMDFANPERARLILDTNFPAQGPVIDGIHRIQAVHSGKALEIPRRSTSAGTSARQRTWTGANHQRFVVTNLGDGGYRIAALHSGLALGVEDTSPGNGALVVQSPWTGADNQVWNIIHNGDDSFRFVAKHSGRVLDVSEASTADGAAIHQWQWTGGENQRWHLIPVNRPPAFTPDPPPPVICRQGGALGGSISASDPDSVHSAIGFAKSGGPPWLGISSSGAITGTPPPGSIGTHTATVLAGDPLGDVSSTTLTLVILDHAASTPAWGNPDGGSWSKRTNWLASVIANGPDAIADFSSMDLAADTTVQLNGLRTVAGLRFGDVVPSHDWTLDSGQGGVLTLLSSDGTPLIDVKNRSATIDTPLDGSAGFDKTGAGTLILAKPSPLSGTIRVSEGTLIMNDTLDAADAMVAASATLGGHGTLGGSLTCEGTLAPGGQDIGNLTIGETLNLRSGAAIEWQLHDWNGPDGTGFDGIDAESLVLEASESDPLVVRVTLSDFAGFSESSRTFPVIRTGTGTTGFDRKHIELDTSALPHAEGTWIPVLSNDDLSIAYVPPGADENQNGIPDDWEILHFGNADPGQNPADGDPDGDGIPNLLEYALGTHPLVANPSPITFESVTVGGREHFQLVIPRNPAATHLEFAVESSADLVEWTTGETVVIEDAPDRLIVRDNPPDHAGERRFLRLRVSAGP